MPNKENQNPSPPPANAMGCQSAEQILDALDESIVLLDPEGVILSVNKGWNDFSKANPLPDGSMPINTEVGSNYLTICCAATGESSELAMSVFYGIRGVLDGRKRRFSCEYPCNSPPTKVRWFLMTAKPLKMGAQRNVVVVHLDITQRKLAELAYQAKQRELSEALSKLQFMAREIKDGLMHATPAKSRRTHRATLPPLAKEADLTALLSQREHEIFLAMVRGERNGDVARRLGLSVKSVSTYKSRVFQKLKIENSAQLLALASSYA